MRKQLKPRLLLFLSLSGFTLLLVTLPVVAILVLVAGLIIGTYLEERRP